MTEPTITARTLASSAAVECLATEWRALEKATPEATGFQAPAWRMICESGKATPRFVAVRENGRLVMLLPLQLVRMSAANVACWLGEPLAQYGDALALPGPRRADWRRAAEAEMARWTDVDLLALTRLRADGVLAASGAPLILADSQRLAAPYIELGEAPPRRHRSIERRITKLCVYGPLRIESTAGSQDRRRAAEQALDFKQAWLRRRRRLSASLSDPDVRACVLDLAEKGVLSAHRLWAGERLASVELGLRHGAAYRSLIGAYDDELADSSPGHAMTLLLLPILAAQGCKRYDFLAPADPYKMAFATGATAMGAFYRPYNARGAMAAFTLTRLRPLAKDAIHALTEAGLPIEPLFRRIGMARSDSASRQRTLLPLHGAISSD